MNDRRRTVELRPDGSLWNHATYRMWLDQQDAARPRPERVERLSKLDPFCVEIEEASRRRERVA